ncbi:MAG: hypothetical protein KF744_09735 [Taibaiella sp.]|nr:hypothetical protein [Taibaiella sp.]
MATPHMRICAFILISALSLTACHKDEPASFSDQLPKHDYAFHVVVKSDLFVRRYPSDFPADSARISNIPSDSMVRFVLNHIYDTLLNIDTVKAQAYMTDMLTKYTKPSIYLYTPDTIAKRGAGNDLTRIN